ncbi:MAG: NYN domain-containing protein [Flavobacteriales bacterium]|nr:NYN domain-containing protein [Flavobacteriales bacterium]
MDNNYLFIDGSALLSDIRRYKKANPNLAAKKFNIASFTTEIFTSKRLQQFHNGGYRRAVFYFVKNDERVNQELIIPNFSEAGVVEDLQVKYCGKKIPSYKKAEEWLENQNAPNYVKDSLYKSEKAVDTQICCDALVYLSLNKLDRLFLYTNDYDFIPLCQSIKSMGANINLIKLVQEKVNALLVKECDAFFALNKTELETLFQDL